MNKSQDSHKEAIRKGIKQCEQAYNTGDAERLVAFYPADETSINALSFTSRGVAEVRNN